MQKVIQGFSKARAGFTLIELLVVIAIIGILASIVLVSLNSARNKGKDARIQTSSSQIRTQLESAYTGAAYPGNAIATPGAEDLAAAPWSSGNLDTLRDDIIAQGGLLKVVGNIPHDAYAIYVTYTSGGGYCVDSTGSNRTFTGAVVTAFTSGSTFSTCAGASAL